MSSLSTGGSSEDGDQKQQSEKQQNQFHYSPSIQDTSHSAILNSRSIVSEKCVDEKIPVFLLLGKAHAQNDSQPLHDLSTSLRRSIRLNKPPHCLQSGR